MCELTRLLCLCRKAQIVKLAGTILLTAVVLLLSSSELVGHPAWKRERMDVKPGITPEARVILEKAIKAHGGEDAIRRMMKGYEAIENVHFGEHGEYRVVWKWDVNGYVVERVEGAQPTIFYSHDRCLDCYLEVCVPCDDYNSDYVSHYRKNQAYFLLPLLNEPFAVSVPETGDDGAQEHSLSVQYPEMAGNMLLVFDKQTHLLERIEYPEFVQGQVSQAQICLSDYRPVGGMLLPFAGRGKKGHRGLDWCL